MNGLSAGEKWPRQYAADFLRSGKHDAPDWLVDAVEYRIDDAITRMAIVVASEKTKEARRAHLDRVPEPVRNKVKHRVIEIMAKRNKRKS